MGVPPDTRVTVPVIVPESAALAGTAASETMPALPTVATASTATPRRTEREAE